MNLQHQFRHHKTVKYPIVTDETLLFMLSGDYGHVAFSTDQKLLGCVDGRELAIFSGYACDGYSPHGITPIPRCGVKPAILHDFLCQVSGVVGSPFTRDDAHKEFRLAMTCYGASHAVSWLYYLAVASPIGTLYQFFRKADPSITATTL